MGAPIMAEDARVLTFLSVRRALGLLGLALPASLLVYAWLLGYGMQPSISEFYHTHMGDILVGCLVAIGIFLICYRGYPRREGEFLSDRWVSTLAGIGVIGIAIFPVAPPDAAACAPGAVLSGPTGAVACPALGFSAHWKGFAWIHFASAALFFVCLALFCFFLFPKGHSKADGSIDWRAGNNPVYLVCGTALALAILFLGAYPFAAVETQDWLDGYGYIFWWETLGVLAFAISWLTKGEMLAGISPIGPGRGRRLGAGETAPAPAYPGKFRANTGASSGRAAQAVAARKRRGASTANHSSRGRQRVITAR
jgi:hypothetical protein